MRTYTPTAVADTTNYTASMFQAIGASAVTTGVIVREVMVSSQATSSSVEIGQFARVFVSLSPGERLEICR